MPVAHVRMRGLRELPLERLLFVVVLGCSVLLLSVVMIRSEEAAGVTKAAPRTLFRDGFIVAQSHDVRRTESNGTAVLVVATGDDKDEKKAVVEEKKSGTQVHVEQQGEHTMTKIKTEDGDEITIKRAANSKKITTISAHEDGKITIENRNEGDTEPPVTPKPNAVNNLRGIEGPPTKEQGRIAETTDKEEEGSTRRVGYEKIAPGKDKPLVVLRDKEMLAADEASLPRRIEADVAAQEADVDKKKKVTVVEVGRSLTKVSVQDAKAHDEDKVEKADTLTRQR